MFFDSQVWIDSKTGFAPNIVLSIHIKKREINLHQSFN